MAIVINGSGTVTGLAVGGLPDGTVDDGTLASSAVTEAKIATDAVTTTKIPAALENTFVSGRKNLIINGAMQINQRGTTATGGSSALHYGGCDRWRMYQENTATAYTLSQDSNSPDGFGSSYKIDVTTADSTLDAADRADFIYRFEGNELQHLKKGTASAESVTLSFWVSSPKTGTHIVEFYDLDNTRQISKAYTVNSANTWEYKTITYAGDTTGAYGNDANASVQISFWLMAGSNFTSGTLNTSWGSVTGANRAVGQVNVMDSTSNNFYLTGVQLELGSTATDFEHRSYGEELALCQRYFEKLGNPDGVSGNVFFGITSATNATSARGPRIDFKVTKRATPTIALTGSLYYLSGPAWQSTAGWETTTQFIFGSQTTTGGVAGTAYTLSTTSGAGNYITADAEL